jgi:hypothetical protein
MNRFLLLTRHQISAQGIRADAVPRPEQSLVIAISKSPIIRMVPICSRGKNRPSTAAAIVAVIDWNGKLPNIIIGAYSNKVANTRCKNVPLRSILSMPG